MSSSGLDCPKLWLFLVGCLVVKYLLRPNFGHFTGVKLELNLGHKLGLKLELNLVHQLGFKLGFNLGIWTQAETKELS